MRNKHESVEVYRLPTCDFCPSEAQYDGKTKVGPWGNMCEPCFKKHGTGLGLGRGQKLLLKRGDENDNI